jgi:hypothetical protein
MMNPFDSLSVALLAASFLPAQTFFYSPPGCQTVEGNNSSSVMVGNVVGYQSRTQQGDASFVGNSLLLQVNSIAWRRDSTGLSAAIARNVELAVTMAHTDLATFTSTFANNYKDAPVTTFTKKFLAVPDWTVAQPPAPFDFVVPFDVPWQYNGTDALLWDVVVTNTDQAGRYPHDWYSTLGANAYGHVHRDTGVGCTTQNGTFLIQNEFRATGAMLDLGFRVAGGPSSAAVTMLLGLTSPNLPIACVPLGTDGLIPVAIGSTSATGTLPMTYVSIPWQASYANVRLTTQGAAIDLSQPIVPVALSNTTLTSAPSAATSPGIQSRRTFLQNTSTGAVGSAPSTTSLATRYAY